MQKDYDELYHEEVSKTKNLREINEELAAELKAVRLEIKAIKKAVSQATTRNMELESQVSTLKSILNNNGK